MSARRDCARVVLAVAAVVAIADWVTKTIATVALDDRSLALGSVITLRLGHNPGVAFGAGNGLPGPVILAATAAVTVAIAVAALRGFLHPPLGAALVVGGAVANLVDRAIGGTVVDFLDLGWWPSFNLADAAITIGATTMVLASLRAPQTRST